MTPKQRKMVEQYENVALIGMAIAPLITVSYLPALADAGAWVFWGFMATYSLCMASLCGAAYRERMRYGTVFPDMRPQPRAFTPYYPTSKTRSRAGYVYILKQVNGEHYKIGRTSNPDNRLATFNVKLPFPVEYEHLIQTDDMYSLESELHQRYAAKRVNGSEFFKLTEQDVIDIISTSA